MSTYFVVPADRTLQDYYFEVTPAGLLSVTDLVSKTTTVQSADVIGIQSGATTFRVNLSTTPAFGAWFHQIAAVDGEEVLITSTLYNRIGNAVRLNTPPSPVLVLGVENGSLVNKTANYFAETHWTHWTRDIHVGDVDGDGRPDLFISNQGREIPPFTAAPKSRIDPVWGEQNGFFLQAGGVWVDASSRYPVTVDFSHGSTLADIDGNGDMEVIVNNLGFFDGYPSKYILDYRDGRLQRINNTAFENSTGTFSESDDFNQDGYDDVVFADKVFLGGNNFGQVTLALPKTELENIGFVNWHGGTTADFNNDGYPDLLKISASNGDARTGVATWVGLRFGLFMFDGEKFVDNTANIGAYNMTDFGINVRALDIDFDGHLDIVNSGPRYFYGTTFPSSPAAAAANMVLRNDGTGRFEKLTLQLDKVASAMYYLKQGDLEYAILTVNGYDAAMTVNGSSRAIKPADVGNVVGAFGSGASALGGFDSQYYLNQYPEVKALLAAGTYSSAHDHYTKAGAAEGKFGFAPGTRVWGTAAADTIRLREGNEAALGQEGDDTLSGGAGNDALDGGPGSDTALYNGKRGNFELTFDDGAWRLRDRTGAEGTDLLSNIEVLRFSDGNVDVRSLPHGGFQDLPDALWHFFIVAFDAAPGAAYMEQIAAMYRAGHTLKAIIDTFTTRSLFLEAYPASLGTQALAQKFVDTVVNKSITDEIRARATADIKLALDSGATFGDLIYTVIEKLALIPPSHPNWGKMAQLFQNEVAVAKFYTETMAQASTDADTLRTVLAGLTPDTDTSTEAALVKLIGVALLEG